MSRFCLFVLAGALFAADFAVIPCGNSTCEIAAIAVGPDQSIYATGTSPLPFVARLDASGKVVAFWTIAAAEQPRAIAVDAAGTAYVAGSTSSKALPVRNAVQPSPGAGTTGFIIALDTKGEIVFATYFGGTAPASGNRPAHSAVNAITVDSAGAVYVTGRTASPDYPITAGLPRYAAGGGYGANVGAFFAKLSPDGKQIVYSGLLGGDSVACGCCSSCSMSQRWTSGDAIAVDRQGNAWFGGSSNAGGMPVTANAWVTDGIGGWVARVPAAGNRVDFLSYLTSSYYTLLPGEAAGATVTSIAVDDAGNAYVAGATSNPEFKTTPGVFQTIFHGAAASQSTVLAPPDGFLVKFDPAGAPLFSTLVGGSGSDQVIAVAVDAAGAPRLILLPTSRDVLAPPGADRGGTVLFTLSPTGSAVSATRLPTGFADHGFLLLEGGRTAFASLRSITTISPGGAQPTVFALGNAAGGTADSVVAPGEMVALYGTTLGPTTPIMAATPLGTPLPQSLAQIRVMFDDTTARVVAVSDSQILAVAPLSLTPGASTRVRVVRPVSMFTAAASVERVLDVVAANPAPFTGLAGSAFLNEDGTWNSEANPARAGSILTVWVTGAGVPVPLPPGAPAPLDGVLAPGAAIYDDACCLPSFSNSSPLGEIVYSGAAPGLPPGTLQISFRAPAASVYDARIGDARGLRLFVAN